MEDFEQQKEALFDLINSWDEKNIKLAMLILESNPALEDATRKAYMELLKAKDYRRLSGLRLLANLNAMKSDDMDEKIQYTMKVHWLKINHCNLNLFPESYLKDLKKLKLVSSLITELPQNVNLLSSLESLDLDGCRNLNKFPDSIQQLSYLKYINLRGTGLSDTYNVSVITGIDQVQDFLKRVNY